MNHLPETGFPRLTQTIGNPKAEPPIPAVIPASKSTWWEGVRTGHYRDSARNACHHERECGDNQVLYWLKFEQNIILNLQ